MGEFIMDTPTYRDMMWYHKYGQPDYYSQTTYNAFNDFEGWLQEQVKAAVQEHLGKRGVTEEECSYLVGKILRLIRCVPAGEIDAVINEIHVSHTHKKSWRTVDWLQQMGH